MDDATRPFLLAAVNDANANGGSWYCSAVMKAESVDADVMSIEWIACSGDQCTKKAPPPPPPPPAVWSRMLQRVGTTDDYMPPALPLC